jgi:hypothetical protein
MILRQLIATTLRTLEGEVGSQRKRELAKG